MSKAYLKCISCKTEFNIKDKIYTCKCCNDLLDVVYDFENFNVKKLKKTFDGRRASNKKIDISGVWRFRELIPFVPDYQKIVTMPEGNTNLYIARRCAEYTGVKKLQLKHQGMNPTGSFKDNGMTTAVTQARILNAKVVACASTGNTAASMGAYAAIAGITGVVFIPEKQIAFGKLSQALDYGVKTLQIEGDFDDAMRLVLELANETDMYLLNSVNPFRLEGQKTIMIEMLQQRGWKVPDRVVVPGGNLGNSSSFGKAFDELYELGFIDKKPMITIIQAYGANPLYRTLVTSAKNLIVVKNVKTLATAIKIGNPINWKKAIRAMGKHGWCDEVKEQEIADAKAIIGREGIGCEPASATTIAGIKKLVKSGEIDRTEDVVAILTGNLLKDPDYTINYHMDSLYEECIYENKVRKRKGKIASNFANKPIRVKADKEAIRKILGI
jgi:threonine synthase